MSNDKVIIIPTKPVPTNPTNKPHTTITTNPVKSVLTHSADNNDKKK